MQLEGLGTQHATQAATQDASQQPEAKLKKGLSQGKPLYIWGSLVCYSSNIFSENSLCLATV